MMDLRLKFENVILLILLALTFILASTMHAGLKAAGNLRLNFYNMLFLNFHTSFINAMGFENIWSD